MRLVSAASEKRGWMGVAGRGNRLEGLSDICSLSLLVACLRLEGLLGSCITSSGPTHSVPLLLASECLRVLRLHISAS